MLLFGHIGITAAVVKAGDILVSMAGADSSHESDSSFKFGAVISKDCLHLRYLFNGIKGRLGSVDYRLVLLGSLLPDIIDKPVLWLAGRDAYLSGRDYAHTLLFNLALLIGGLVLIRYRKSWLLIISLSSLTHLILDQMWNSPVALLWPLLGPLPKGKPIGYLFDIFRELFLYPDVYVPEIAGLVIILLFAFRLVKTKSVVRLLRDGAIE